MNAELIAWFLENGGSDNGYDVLCLSGRGDKDLAEVLEWTKAEEVRG